MSISDKEHVGQSVRSTLRPGPALPGHTTQQDESSYSWIIDQTLILCSPPEYFCLKVLLEQANRRVPFAQLTAYLPGAGADTNQRAVRWRMRQLISSLRSKVWMLGITIISLRGLGYMLILEPQEGKSTRRTSR